MSHIDKKRVLVSGAGIGGLTTAYWFNQIGWDVVVLEKAESLRKGEFIIDFQGSGWDVAEKMGITDELKARETGITALSFKNHKDEEHVYLNMDDFSALVGVKGKMVSINRRELQDLLFEKVADNVEIRYGSSVTQLSETDTSVDVQINDGETETFDLVVGADGLHSNIRKLVFGEEKDLTRYLGYFVGAYNVTGLTTGEPNVMNILRQPNKQATFLDKGDGTGLAMMVFKDEKGDYVPSNQRKALLQETFKDMQGIIPDALNAITDDMNIYLDTTTQVVMPKWYSKRVALIGDAGYCLTLVSGQGASMAMAGAYILAKEIEKAGNTEHNAESMEQALANYDNRLRDFVTDLQNKTRKFAKQFVPSSEFGIWIMDKGMSLIENPIVKHFASNMFGVKSIFEVEQKK